MPVLFLANAHNMGSCSAVIINQAKKLVVGVMGFTVLFVGIAMLVLPGPAVIFIPAGLAILATQFAWARNLLKRVKRTIRKKQEEGNSSAD